MAGEDMAHPLRDRAGAPSGLSPQAVSSEAAHPLRGPCAKQTTRATIIAPNGERFVGTNDCLNPQAVCPRAAMPTGIGYELCTSICRQTGHAEVNACLAAGEKARGGKLYLEGHYYACDNCKRVAGEHGVEIVIGAPPKKSGGMMPKRKGYEFERTTVNLARQYGLEARRVPLSGAGDEKGDVCITSSFGKVYRCELKRRKNLPEWIVKALGDHDAMIMRGDRGKALAVIPLDTLLGLLQ